LLKEQKSDPDFMPPRKVADVTLPARPKSTIVSKLPRRYGDPTNQIMEVISDANADINSIIECLQSLKL